MIERLDERAVQKVSGPTWESLRNEFFDISRTLLSVSPDVHSQLTTIYVKFCTSSAMNEVFAVVWIKTSSKITVGLSLPDDLENERLGPAPQGHTYRGLTKYFIVTKENGVHPPNLLEWAKLAYETARSSGTT